MDFWKGFQQTVHITGICESEEQRKQGIVIEKNGIKIAVLSYADTASVIHLPKEKEYIVASASRKRMEEELEQARKSSDVLIVFMHWGEEYASEPSPRQRELAKYLSERGADLIVGSHPHVLQTTEWISASDGRRTLVAYSLGNFLSCQHKNETLLGGMLTLSFRRSHNGEITIDSPVILPIITHYNRQLRGFRIYPLNSYADDLAVGHGISRFGESVSVDYFEKLAKAKTKIIG